MHTRTHTPRLPAQDVRRRVQPPAPRHPPPSGSRPSPTLARVCGAVSVHRRHGPCPGPPSRSAPTCAPVTGPTRDGTTLPAAAPVRGKTQTRSRDLRTPTAATEPASPPRKHRCHTEEAPAASWGAEHPEGVRHRRSRCSLRGQRRWRSQLRGRRLAAAHKGHGHSRSPGRGHLGGPGWWSRGRCCSRRLGTLSDGDNMADPETRWATGGLGVSPPEGLRGGGAGCVEQSGVLPAG